jgi:hypothetical protein
MDPVTLEAHAGNGEQANENSRGAELRNIELDGGQYRAQQGTKISGRAGQSSIGAAGGGHSKSVRRAYSWHLLEEETRAFFLLPKLEHRVPKKSTSQCFYDYI